MSTEENAWWINATDGQEIVLKEVLEGQKIELPKPAATIPCIPCGARLLVIRDEVSEEVGSIILPETSKSRPASGVVRMAGPMAPKEFAPGVRVLFGEYAGTVARIGEAVVLILDPSEVIAFVQEPAVAAG